MQISVEVIKREKMKYLTETFERIKFEELLS